METELSSTQRFLAVSRLLSPRPFPVDILVKRPHEIKRALAAGDFFIQEIISQGKVLYERQCLFPYPFPKTHDLRLLENLCTSAGVLIPIDNALLDTLSSVAVLVRYPCSDPTLDEAREAFKIAKAVRRFVRKLLGLK
jgi:hypothetical protein